MRSSTDDGNQVFGARSVFSAAQRWGLLAAFALIIVFRLPHAWAQGRFQDEEATVFLAYAWHFPWQEALFRSFAGYLNLAANGSTVLAVQLIRAGILPLERAPYFTMIVALAAQLLPAVLILTGKAQWLAGRLAVIAALLLIAASPATEEVFFNVLHIQFHLALCVGLILALDVPTGRVARWGYPLILFTAPLCGPGAIVMLPLYALKALIDRERGRWIQVASFCAGAAVQLLLFYRPSLARGHVADPITVAGSMFLRQIVLPAGGIDFASKVGSAMYFSRMAGGTGWWWCAGAALILFGLLVAIALRRRDAAIWLILSGLGIAAASLGFGMVIAAPVSYFQVFDGERYNFLPNTLLGLGLIALAMRPGSAARPVYGGMCVILLVTAATQFRQPFKMFANGPSWSAEVRKWRADHRHPLATWPSSRVADLSDQPHRCTPPPTRKGRASDPRYCESGWISGFYDAPSKSTNSALPPIGERTTSPAASAAPARGGPIHFKR